MATTPKDRSKSSLKNGKGKPTPDPHRSGAAAGKTARSTVSDPATNGAPQPRSLAGDLHGHFVEMPSTDGFRSCGSQGAAQSRLTPSNRLSIRF